MPYTYKSLAVAWLIIFALVAVSASGATGGLWFVLLLVVAFAAPALILRSPADAATTSPERPLIVADEPERSPSYLGGIDVQGWENEGGAHRMPLSGGVREPARATS